MNLLYLILMVLSLTFAEVLIPVQITPGVKTINTLTTYTFFINRKLKYINGNGTFQFIATTKNLSQGSNLIVQFPSTYQTKLTNQKCQTINFQYSSSSVNCLNPVCSISGNNILISNCTPTQIAADNVTIVLSDILNPFPAIQVGPFLISLGQDTTTTASSPRPYFTLDPGTLTGSINFNSSFINSTSIMIVSIIPTNSIPLTSSSIQVLFPSSWVNDIGNASIRVSTPVCTDTAGFRTLSCNWTNTNLITINISGFSQNITTNFTFTISNIRSPPTTEPSNKLTLTTLTNGNIIDTNTADVTGLLPKNMQVYSTSTQNIVNTNFILSFGIFTVQSFNTLGTTIEIAFPVGSIISNTPSVQAPQLNINSISKNGLNITVNLSGNSLFSPGSIAFGINTYTAPSTTIPTDPITVTIKKNTYPVQIGSFRFTALPSQITGTMIPSLYIINSITMYTFSVTLNDPISNTGCLQFILPSSVSINYSSCNASGFNVNSQPNCSSSNSSIFRACNLFTSSMILPSLINISLNNGINPISSQPTSSFVISSYYSNMTGLVSNGTIPGFIPNPSSLDSNYLTITPSNTKTMASNVNYSIKFNNRNKIPVNGRIYIIFPNDIIVTSLTNPNCQAAIGSGSIISTFCSAANISSGTNFTFTTLFTTGQIVANTSILITINNIFRNPVSTQLMNSFAIKTADSLGYLIDQTLNYLPVFTPGDLTLTSSIQQSNRTNSAISNYTFSFSQLSPFSSNSQIQITFPPTITPQSPLLCVDQSSINLSCILQNSVVFVNLSSTVSNTGFKIMISNIKNAPSLSISNTFKILSKTSTGALYAQNTNATIVNTEPSKFSITSSFSHQTLATSTSLALQFSPTYSIINHIIINFPSSFTITGLNCNSFSFNGTCSNTSTVGSLVINGTFVSSVMSLTISGFISPSEPVSGYITISSFDATNSLIDQNLQSISFTTNCTFPCNTCSGSKTNCTSCYTTLPSVSQVYYFNNTCSTQCTDGYYGNISDYKCYSCIISCKTCNEAANNCTDCNANSSYPYLETSQTLGQCVNSCNLTSYPNNNSYPVKCTICEAPCVTCTSAKQCLSCNSSQYFFNKSCYSSCPVLISIPNQSNKSCNSCQNPCATCQNTINTCLSCVQNYFLNGTSCNQCLSPKIIFENNCVSCSPSCATCNQNPSNCTSCQSKVLFDNQCINTCPTNYAAINGICYQCNTNCKTCLGSVTNCSSCDSMYLVPSFGTCVATCPENLFLNPSDNTCIQCASPCFTCNGTAFTCSSCRSGYYFLANQCVQNCPNGTSSNGTHCISNGGGSGGGGSTTVNNTLNAKVFPLPFTIGGTIVLITSGVSKFQNPLTFFSGAVFSLFGILQWGASITFLILYLSYYHQINTISIVIIAILSILYIINIISLFVYFYILKKDKQFKIWYQRKCSSKAITIIGFIVCGLMTFKFMNIVFCRLFSFYLFKAKLQSIHKLFGFNFVIFLSAPHTLGTIAIAAYVAYQLSSNNLSQLYLQAIDLIIVSIFTCIFGIATSHVNPDFFDQLQDSIGGKGNDSDYLSGIGDPLNGNEIKQKGSSLSKYMSQIQQHPSLMQLRPDQISSQFLVQNNIGDENYLKNNKNLNKVKNSNNPNNIINEQNQNQNSNSSRNSKKKRFKKKTNTQNIIFAEGHNNSTQNNEIVQNDILKEDQRLPSDNYLNTEQQDGQIYPLDAQKYQKMILNQQNCQKNEKNMKQKLKKQKDNWKEQDEERKNDNFTLGKFDENLDISDINNNGKDELNDQSDISELQKLDKAEAATRKTKNGEDTSNQYLTDNPMKQFLGSDQESDFKFGTKSQGGRKKKVRGENGEEILEDDQDQNRKNNGPQEINEIDDSFPEDPLDIQNHPYHVIKKNKRLPTDPSYRTLQIGEDKKPGGKHSHFQQSIRNNNNTKNNLPSDQSNQKINQLKLKYNKDDGEDGQRGLNKSPTNDPLKIAKKQKKSRNQLLASSSEFTQKQDQDNQTFRNQVMIKPTSQLDLIELTKEEDEKRKLKKQPKKFKVVYDTSGVLDQNQIEFQEIGVSPSDFNHHNQRFIDEQFEGAVPNVIFSKNDVPQKPKVVMVKSKDLLDKQFYSYDRMPMNQQMFSRKQSSIQQQPSIGQIVFKPTSAVDRNRRGFSSHMGQRSKNMGFTQRQNKRQKTLQHTDNTAQFYFQKAPPPKNNKQLQKIYLQRLVGPHKSRSTIGKSNSKLT